MRSRLIKKLILIGSAVLFLTNNSAAQDDKVIIAEVCGKTITKSELYSRAEYTPRPDYCRMDNYIHRKIVLNTLIAEKLMAIEAGEENELTRSEEYNAYLTGRKEQAMRQVHYYEKAYVKAAPDSAQIEMQSELAARTYKLSFFRVKDSSTAYRVYNSINSEAISFDSAYKSISLNDTIPSKKISYFSNESSEIINTLFDDHYSKGEFLKPQFVDNSFLLIRIDGWRDKPVISQSDKFLRRNDVKLKLTEIKAAQLYNDYVAGLMRGKRVDFNWETFKKLVELTAPYYLKDAKEKEVIFNRSFWRASDENEVLMDNLGNSDLIMNSPLLKYDGEIWSVKKLLKEIKKRPLVFRKNELQKREFAGQLKLAIVDLIRDKEITEDAYNSRYDEHELVIRNTRMWRENLLANYKKYLIVAENNAERNSQKYLIEKILNPYVKSLQNKYSAQIKINIAEFEGVQLSRIDMLAMQTDMAFPFIVPLFPELTSLSKLDYGNVIN